MGFRGLERDLGTSRKIISEALKDLSYGGFTQPVSQVVTLAQREVRVECRWGLLSKLWCRNIGPILLTGEVFTQDTSMSTRTTIVSIPGAQMTVIIT